MKFLKLIFFLLFYSMTLIFAQNVGYGKEFKIENSNSKIIGLPSFLKINENKFLLCLKSKATDGSGYGLFAQMFNNKGEKINERFQVNDSLADFTQNPFSFNLNFDKFIICWITPQKDGSGEGIFAQIFDNEGNKIGSEFQVNSFTKSDQVSPCLLNLDSNRFVICWQSDYQDGSRWGIFAQIFDNEGNKIGNEFQVNTYTNSWQTDPRILQLSNNKFIISWENINHETGDGISAQLFNYNGEKINTEIQISPFTKNEINYYNIKKLGSDKFIVYWTRDNQDGSLWGIFAQIFQENGENVGNKFQVNTSTNNSQRNPTFLEFNNKFIFIWQSNHQLGFGERIFAQIFNEDGEKNGNEFQVNSNSDYANHNFMILNLDYEKFIIAWQSSSLDGLSTKIFAQLFNNQGNKVGNEFRLNTINKYRQIYPRLFELGDNKFFSYWYDCGYEELYYQMVGKIYLDEVIDHNLTDFECIKPFNNENIETIIPQFTWQYPSNQHINFPWEIEYNLYIAEDEEFTNPLIIEGITDTTYQIDTLAAGKTYFWKALAKTYYGDSLWSSNVNGFFIDHNATDVKDNNPSADGLPTEFVLEQNYPNPFNPTTTINFTIPANVGTSRDLSLRNITLIVYDVLGNKIKTLVNEQKSPGNYSVNFDCSSALGGRGLTSGIYFYRLTYGGKSITKKMLLLR